MDWPNILRGQTEMHWKAEEYDRKAGFEKLKQWLANIGKITRMDVYTPFHDIYGHFEFLMYHRFTIILCPTILMSEITSERIIEDTMDLVENYDMKYLIVGGGNRSFEIVLKQARQKGIKTGIIYGSDVSLSPDIKSLASPYPSSHELAGQPMLHLFSPVSPSR